MTPTDPQHNRLADCQSTGHGDDVHQVAEDFLALIFGQFDYPVARHFFLASQRHDPKHWTERDSYPLHGGFSLAVKDAFTWDANGESAYFCPQTFTMAGLRNKKFVAEKLNCAWADLDTCNPDNLLVRPSIIVESSPGRWQAYWLFDKPVNATTAEGISKRIAYFHAHQGADKSGWDLTQVLRLPGTHNHKYPDLPELPVVRIIESNKRKYRVSDFDCYPPVAGNPSTSAVKVELPKYEDLPIGSYIQGFIDDALAEQPVQKTRSDRASWCMRRAAELGFSLGQIRTLIHKFPPAVDKWPPHEIDNDLIRFIRDDYPTITVQNGYEDRFWNARPELRHIRNFAQSRMASPWATLGVVLARVVTSCHPTLVLPPTVGTVCSLNLFVGIVGQSGEGKGISFGVAKDAFVWAADVKTEKPGSGEGLAHGYMRRPRSTKEDPFPEPVQHTTSVLFSVTEIDSFDAVTKRTGATLLPELRSAYMGEPLGFQYADPTKRLPVPEHMYRLCLIAGIQPAKAGVLLNDADGGTPQRFIWLPATDGGAPDELPDEPEPLSWKCPYEPSEHVSEDGSLRMLGKLNRVTIAEVAKQTIIQARRDRNRGSGTALDGHALLTRLKVAVALGLLAGRVEANEEDWHLAGLVMRKSDETRNYVIGELAKKAKADNEKRGENEGVRESAKQDVVDRAKLAKVAETVLNKLTDEWQSMSTLKRSVYQPNRAYVEPAIDALVTAGKAEIQAISYQGTPGYQVRKAPGSGV